MSLGTTVYQQLTPWLKKKRWIIGFSGGMDSTVLLHILVSLKQKYTLPDLQAVYIHHGLQAVAESWPCHCQKICDQLGVPLQVIAVAVEKQASIEQAARNARYDAFSQLMGVQDILLTAQHQNDQAETVLFRLVRGAGVRGLTGTPNYRALGQGNVVRPLLNIPYVLLKRYAEQQQLQWINDPTNDDTQFARNYLRHQVIPTLENYWPQAVNNISQAANHLQEAQQLLNELAEQDLIAARAPDLYSWLKIPSLLVAPLTQLSWVRQKNALSCWLSAYTLLPSTTHWQGCKNLLNAAKDANPIWQLHHQILCRSNDRVWLLTNHDLKELEAVVVDFSEGNQVIALPDNGEAVLQGDLPQQRLFISYRKGGEKLSLALRGHRDLKRLFNEQAIPTFIRHRLPLLFNEQGELIAVANFPEWRHKDYQQSFSFDWTADFS